MLITNTMTTEHGLTNGIGGRFPAEKCPMSEYYAFTQHEGFRKQKEP